MVDVRCWTERASDVMSLIGTICKREEEVVSISFHGNERKESLHRFGFGAGWLHAVSPPRKK